MSRSTRICLLTIFIIFTQSVFAKSHQLRFRPSAGIFVPESKTLRNFYNQNILIDYGGDLIIITNFYNYGVYLGLNKYSIKIKDDIQGDLDESTILYKFGILKRFQICLITIDAKLGLMKRIDDLLTLSNEARLGFEFGFVLERNIYKRLSLFSEINYNYEHIKIPYYVNCVYTRHQEYLAGQNFTCGGYFFNIGLSILLK